MGRMVLMLLLAIVATGCTNLVRSGLLNSNSIFLQPSADHRVYLQIRNTSENQQLTLSDLPAKLASKAMRWSGTPSMPAIGCRHGLSIVTRAKAGVTPQQVVSAGFGSGIGSGGTPLSDPNLFMGTGANELAGMMPPAMAGMRGMMAPGGAMPDLNAMMVMVMSQASARGGYPGGMQQAPPEGVYYLCAVDVQITERTKESLSASKDAQVEGASSAPRVHRVRMVGHVLQKNLNVQEATPILQEKLSTGIAGMF